MLRRLIRLIAALGREPDKPVATPPRLVFRPRPRFRFEITPELPPLDGDHRIYGPNPAATFSNRLSTLSPQPQSRSAQARDHALEIAVAREMYRLRGAGRGVDGEHPGMGPIQRA